MATAQYKDVSPYLVQDTPPPVTDVQYAHFLARTKPQHRTSPLRVALFGLGRIGVMYLRNILSNPHISLCSIVISPRQHADTMRKQFNIPADILVTSDAESVYSDANITASIIVTSTSTHVPIILKCLAGGKAVYCEKPISGSTGETTACYAAAEQAALPLFCAFNRRFHPTYQHIQAQVRAGAVGHVQTIKTVSRDSPLIPSSSIGPSGGIFDDFAVHDIDLLMWVLGEVPTGVYVTGSANIPEFAQHRDYDNVIISLTFASGTLGSVDLNRYSSYGYDQRLEVVGMGGMLHCESSKPDTTTLHAPSGARDTPLYYSFPSYYDTAFRLQLDHFVEVVQGGVPCSVTDAQTRAVAKVITACKESAVSKLPVSLTWEGVIPEY